MLLLPEAREIANRAIVSAGPCTVRLTRPAFFSLRSDAGGRGVNELVRALPFGRVRLSAWNLGPEFGAGESMRPLIRRDGWFGPRTAVLVIARNTPLRVMRMTPQIELWPPDVAPLGHRWRKLEALIPDPDVIL